MEPNRHNMLSHLLVRLVAVPLFRFGMLVEKIRALKVAKGDYGLGAWLFPSRGVFRLSLGMISLKLAETEIGFGHFQELTDPRYECVWRANAWIQIGTLFTESDNIDRGVDAYNKALALCAGIVDPLSRKGVIADAKVGLGHAYFLQGDIVTATQFVLQALNDAPDDIVALRNLPVCLEREGEYQGALTAATRAHELNPADQISRDLLASLINTGTERA